MTHDEPNLRIKPVMYRNSGDTEYGEREGVVGYYAMVAYIHQQSNQGQFDLSIKDKKDLLRIARSTVTASALNETVPETDTAHLSTKVMQACGAFVTLHKTKQLRGCIGQFMAEEPLYEVVREMAEAAAMRDTRFVPLKPEELEEIDIEISVLTPLKKISSTNEIILGRHGIYIKKGLSAGTLLPQVATETGWQLEEFLGHCARDKAGIGWNGWKDAEIFVYEAIVFSEAELK
jgi:hypothetical protein